jgi:zinc protease
MMLGVRSSKFEVRGGSSGFEASNLEPRTLIASCLTAVLCLALLAAPADAAEITPHRFVAPNGLTVLVVEQHALPIVQIEALVKTGSVQDPPEKAGLANLTAGLLDEGTTTRSATQLAEQIEFVGGALEVKTTHDFTTAAARVLTKDTDLGFELLADILLRPAFPEAELARVKKLVLGEITAQKDEPGAVAGKAFSRLVFDGHPYSWPVNGTEETLPAIDRADVQAFHAREYLPNRTILAVVGDVTVERVRALVEKHFGSWQQGPEPERTAGAPAAIDKPVVELIDKELTQTTLVLGHLGISRTNPDFYAITVMNYILGAGGFSSRLMDSIRDKQGLAYGVMSQFEPRAVPGPFLVSLQTRNATANQALAGVLKELRAMQTAPVSAKELAEAKSYLIGSFPMRFDTTHKLAEVLCQVEFYGLGPDYFTQYPSWIAKVTADDVVRVAKQYLHPDRYALVAVGKMAEAKLKQP